MRVFRILQFHDIVDRRSRSLPTSRAAAPEGACRTEPRTRRPGTRQLPHTHAHPMPRRAQGIHGTVGEELCQGSQKAPRRPRPGARRQLLLIPRPNQAHPSEEHHLQRPRIEVEAPLRPGCIACIPVHPGTRPDVRPAARRKNRPPSCCIRRAPARSQMHAMSKPAVVVNLDPEHLRQDHTRTGAAGMEPPT